MAKPPAPHVLARRAAAHYVDREDLVPPLDIEAILSGLVASVERTDWPIDGVDAVVANLDQGIGNARVFVRATRNLLRERFTMAHELGHLLLPWHVPHASCEVGEGDFDIDPRSVTSEIEADVFASCVLVPDRWLADLMAEHAGDMSIVISRLNSAEVSTPAALFALRRYLLAGWVFRREQSGWTVVTPGTVLDRQQGFAPKRMRALATDSGQATLNGETISWYSFLPPESELPQRPAADTRTVHALLLSAASRASSDEAPERIAMSANGKIGGGLREAAGRSESLLFRTMLHRLADWEHADLLEVPDFRLWLAEKCRAVSAGSTKRRRITRNGA